MSNEQTKLAAREIALKDYEKSAFHQATFEKDFNHFMTSRKMITRFLKTGVINEKLLLNTVVILLNVFGTEKVTVIFRILLEDVQFSVIKSFLMFLHQYDFRVGADVYPNRIIVDILRDTSIRFNLEHL